MLFLFSIHANVGAENNKLLKIEAITSNNELISHSYLNLYDIYTMGNLEKRKLTQMLMKELEFEKASEIELFKQLLYWVNEQWKHNGWNAAAPHLSARRIVKNARKGANYRCVEYAKVLKDALVSLGFVARIVNVKSAEVAYGGAGMGHAAVEVWSNERQKWMFLDPQFGAYARYKGEILNYYEIFSLRKKGYFDQIDFSVKSSKIGEYKSFLSHYFGYLAVYFKLENKRHILNLKLNAQTDFYTFQAQPLENNLFTKDPEDLYFKVNQVMARFNFSEKERLRFSKNIAEMEFKNVIDYRQKMPMFAPNPEFDLCLTSNMPWFDHYELYINESSEKIDAHNHQLRLKEGDNLIRIVPVNKNGVKGLPLNMYIKCVKTEQN